MSVKKITAILSFVFFASFGGAYDFNSFLEQNGERSASLDAGIKALFPGAGAKDVNYKYNYSPIVFEIDTLYQQHLYCDYEDGQKINLDYKNAGFFGSSAGEYHAKCYGTLINKDFMITHKNCLQMPVDKEYTIPESTVNLAEYEPINTKFKKDGRELVYNRKNSKKFNNYWIDKKSGAVLLKVSDLCLQQANAPANVCLKLWEWATEPEAQNFTVNSNYGTIILSDISPKDNIQNALSGKVFFNHKGEKKAAVKAARGLLTLKGKAERSFVGEPVFYKADGSKNIFVGIKTPSNINNWEYTKSDSYALFSHDFTKMIKKNVNTGGVRLTKDLKGQTLL
ncbi:MAG: hypothetical protein PUB86_02060 [Elusimicrobia bacterium]|nr:hypothetical protein [Elusimicrobiota bacterium]